MKTLLYLLERGVADPSEIAGLLGCHVNLTRGDVRRLEGLCQYVHLVDNHTALSLMPVYREAGLGQRCREHAPQKRKIARRALEFVCPGDIVLLSGGGSAFFFALELLRSDLRNVTVVTNHPLSHAILLSKVGQLKTIGGTMHKRVGAVEFASGSLGFLRQAVTKSVLGVEGVSHSKGACCSELDAALQREAALRTEGRVMILADHSKLGKDPREPFVSFRELEKRRIPYTIVTDEDYDDEEEAQQALEELKSFPADSVCLA